MRDQGLTLNVRRAYLAAIAAVFVGLFVVAPATSPAFARTANDEEPLPVNLVDMSVAGLQRNPPFFEIPRALLAISDADAIRVVTAIGASGTPVYIVILPGQLFVPLARARDSAEARLAWNVPYDRRHGLRNVFD